VNIYVGNLSFKATDAELRAAFEPYGEVKSAKVVEDRDTGRSRGFGFVEMTNDDEGRKAIEALNNKEIAGRAVRVNEARPREERPPRG
jgi:RNA recognition motif-containing protein